MKENHYVDNKKFFDEMCKWKEKVNEASACDEPRPPVTEYIGECFLKIAERLSHRPNLYAHNFDPEKSTNPFSYFTQFVYFAFVRRIEKEKKQSYIKYKMMEENDDGTFSQWFKENYFERGSSKKEIANFFSLSENDVDNFDTSKKKKKKKKKKDDSKDNTSDSTK